MEADDEMKPEEPARMICGEVEATVNGVVVPVEPKPIGDWAMMQMLCE